MSQNLFGSLRKTCRCQESRRRTSNSFCVLLPCLAFFQCLAGVAHQMMGHSCSYPVHINRQYPTDRHRCRCQAVTTVREAFSSQFPFLQRVRSMSSVSFAMLRAEKAEIWQTLETLCHEDFLVRFGVSCRCQESRRRTSNGFCMLLPCPTLGQCLAGVAHQLMGHSCSYPVHINRQYPTDRHRCRCQAVTTERSILFTVSIFAKSQVNE